jgi:hypothetical protein
MLKPVKISELYQVLYIVDEFLLDEREPNYTQTGSILSTIRYGLIKA